MQYLIRHITQFRYSAPIRESVMAVRMQPLSEGLQSCLAFQLEVNPHARVSTYGDYMGNIVHSFDIPQNHEQLTITARSQVYIDPPEMLPAKLPGRTWDDIDRLSEVSDFWELLTADDNLKPSKMLDELAHELNVRRRDDPLSVLREINHGIFDSFEYMQSSTSVDSSIDEALNQRAGVCQDFAHIMLALVRTYLRIPCRYVSGYLYHRRSNRDRSVDDASHAWIEVLLPELGWVGFDPTNNLIGGERHIRVATGADYRAVPPTRGVYKGDASSELGVSVRVHLIDDPDVDGPVSITYVPLPPMDGRKHIVQTVRQDSQQQQQQ